MTHLLFDFSVKLLEEKVAGVQNLTRRNRVLAPSCGVQAFDGTNYSVAFPLLRSLRHRFHLGQPQLKSSHGEEITHCVNTLCQSLSHSLQSREVIFPTNASI